jgi:Acetoacetate decarboxylase (ADC)
MADYVEYGPLAAVPGPLRCESVTQWCFPLEADRGRLEALCEEVFAAPSGEDVKLCLLGSHVLLTLGRIERIVSEQKPFTSMGWAAENQAAIWIPLARFHEDGHRRVADELVMFTPFMWVDNPISLVSGREMYGFPKAMGWLDLPQPGAAEATFGLDVFGMNYESNEEPSRRPLVRITRGKQVHELTEITFSTLRHVGTHLRQLVAGEARPSTRLGWSFAEHVVENMAAGGVRQVFLKQVRAVGDGSQAALQQVTEATYQVNKMSGRPLEHEYEVELRSLSSDPLAERLGLQPNLTTRTAFRTESEFVLETGRVVWDAAAHPAKP